MPPTVSLKLGYLLPTRENIMLGQPDTDLLLDAARRSQQLGFDSVWVGDSLLARPRHDPLTLLAAVAGAAPGMYLGTAVLLPVLRNPVVLAQQLATLDQLSGGKLIVGAGIAADIPPVRAEFAAAGVPFAGRVGRLMEGFRLCRALWRGEPVTWQGRWELNDATLAPLPKQPGGPPIWLGTGAAPGIQRAARHFDGWMPIGPDVAGFTERRQLFTSTCQTAGRPELPTALYLTIAIDDDSNRADATINTYLERYYGVPAAAMRGIQACYGGSLAGVLDFIRGYVLAGAEHIILRLVGDHAVMQTQLAQHRDELSASS